MTGFVLVGDDMIPLNQIELASPAWDLHGKHPRAVVRVRGKDVPLGSEAIGAVLMRPTQLIPAAPGTYVLSVHLYDDAAEAEVFKTAVVAWALCFDGETRPVTPYGVNDGNGMARPVHIELPDGSVRSISMHDEAPAYDDVESYRQGEGARKLAEREARIARAAQANRSEGI